MRYFVVAILLLHIPFNLAMAEYEMLIVDDRSSGSYLATTGDEWRLITDEVMGGVSNGRLSADTVEHQSCLRLEGDVKLDNNGGFIQAALDLPTDLVENIGSYTGLVLSVHGNGERYNVHLRTRDNLLPWQSYRASFTAAPEWQEVSIAFAEFQPYRTDKALDVSRLKRIGVVAIGREFKADLCIGSLGFYR